jgi:hypothetical protein
VFPFGGHHREAPELLHVQDTGRGRVRSPGARWCGRPGLSPSGARARSPAGFNPLTVHGPKVSAAAGGIQSAKKDGVHTAQSAWIQDACLVVSTVLARPARPLRQTGPSLIRIPRSTGCVLVGTGPVLSQANNAGNAHRRRGSSCLNRPGDTVGPWRGR